MSTKKHLVIYTDGSCIPNPGKGGWAYVALHDDVEIHCSGSEKRSTNNIMEMTAVIQALKNYRKQKYFSIYSDSQYVINCAQGKWKRKKNKELWEVYDRVSQGKEIIWTWVKGHSGDRYNDLVDKLARDEVFL